MMAYELKDGQGSLFKNDRKEPGSKQPDSRGELMIGGVLYELGGWTKEGKNGKWVSLSAKPKGDKPAAKKQEPDDDIPW